MNEKIVYWVYFFAVWSMNIYDLIVGEHFYPSTGSIIALNFFGFCAFILLLPEKEKK